MTQVDEAPVRDAPDAVASRAARAQPTGFITVAIGLVAGLVAALGPAAPTATPVIDAVLITLAVLAIVVVGERAPWWSVALAAGVAMAIAINPLLIAVALVALAGALWS